MTQKNGLNIITRGSFLSFAPANLSFYMRYNSTLGYCIYNLLYNRRTQQQKFLYDDCSAAQGESYWWLGIFYQKA